MAKNFGKALYKLGGQGQSKTKALKLLEEWSKIPHARWIPYHSLMVSGFGEMTQRQADWIVTQVKRKAKVTITLIKARVS